MAKQAPKKRTKKETVQKRYPADEVKGYLDALNEHSDTKFDAIAEQYFGLTDKIDGVVEMVGKLAEDMSIVKGNIEFIKGDLRKKVDYDEFSSLERRVAVLERKR